jgi:hypothetical protein
MIASGFGRFNILATYYFPPTPDFPFHVLEASVFSVNGRMGNKTVA